MKEPRIHLPGDLQALRYLDALECGRSGNCVVGSGKKHPTTRSSHERWRKLDDAVFQEIPSSEERIPDGSGDRCGAGSRLGQCDWHPGGRRFASDSCLASARYQGAGSGSSGKADRQ